MNQQEMFFSFLVEYASFLESLVDTEEEKLRILLANKLPELEKSIAVQQMNEMKIENLEKKRIGLQKEAGFENMAFSEIIARAPQDKIEELTETFDRVRKAVSQIKFLNDKSMNILKMNLEAVGLGSQSIQRGYSKDMKEVAASRRSILETKV